MLRYDRFELKATKTDEGFIRDTPVIGRTGLMTYYNHDGTKRIEYRPPEEAFNADSLNSLLGKPVTVGHKAMVSASNAAAVQPIGSVLSAGRQDGNNIVADMVIYNLPTNARELSCGYKLDLDETPGTTPDGQHYDAVQRNIRYNHVAVVAKGRAGVARLNMDGDQIDEEDEGGDTQMSMTKVRTDSGIEYDAAPEVKVYIEKLLQERNDSKTAMDTLQAKYDAAISDLDKEKKAHKDAMDQKEKEFTAAVKERVDMLEVAKNHNIDKADTMSNADIKKAVIKAVHGDSVNMDGKSDDYIDAMFDMAKQSQQKRQDGMARQRQTVLRGDGSQGKQKEDHVDEYDVNAAMAKLREDEANAWSKPV